MKATATGSGRLRLLQIAFGVLALTAIAWQLVIQIRLGSSLVNFFSYFTNLSNLFAAVVLLLGASDRVRAIAVVNMIIVGVVFAILLRNVDLGSLRPWVNVVLHYVMPCVVVADWLLSPPRTRLAPRQVLVALAVPALYLAYLLVRGAVVGWYPYPFLDPANGGYGVVAAYAVGIAVTFLIAGWIVVALGNRPRVA